MTAQGWRAVPGLYRDSVALMRLSADLQARPGITQAAVVMATPANLTALAESGLTASGAVLRPDDLLLAVAGQGEDEVAAALDWAEAELRRPPVAAGTPAGELAPRTLPDGLRQMSGANLVSISVPGEYAAAEALKALKAGQHVFLFSSGVSLADEARLKRLAAERGLLLMGAECGTAMIGGVPLGFANAVRRGNIGLVAASGSGLQEVMCLIDRWGGGISHAIGAGGRDLHGEVGGLTTLAGLQMLEADPDTRVIVIISKPPAPEIAERVLAQVARLTKPCIVAFLGIEPASVQAGGAKIVGGLEEAARAALAAAGIALPAISQLDTPRPKAPAGRFVRGLFVGGTLCSEAAQILAAALGPVAASENGAGWPAAHLCLDLGDEQYTRGRPHPMIDARLRAERMQQAAADPMTGVILFDVVLGYGASADPVGPLLAAIRSGGPQYIVHVVGVEADPQNLNHQEERLRRAGVWVAPTNAAAAHMTIEAIRS